MFVFAVAEGVSWGCLVSADASKVHLKDSGVSLLFFASVVANIGGS